MTPFVLQRAQAGDPICTKAGKPARFNYCRIGWQTDRVVVATVGDDVSCYFTNGRYCGSYDDPRDLMMADTAASSVMVSADGPVDEAALQDAIAAANRYMTRTAPAPADSKSVETLRVAKEPVVMPAKLLDPPEPIKAGPPAPTPAGLLSRERALVLGAILLGIAEVADALLNAQRQALDAAEQAAVEVAAVWELDGDHPAMVKAAVTVAAIRQLKGQVGR